MLKIFANEYVDIGKDIANLEMNFYMSDTAEPDSQAWSEDEKAELKSALAEMARKCEQIGMPTALAALQRASRNLPETQREFAQVVSVLEHELTTKLFLFIPSERAKYHEHGGHFKTTTWANLPGAATEMLHAGNCFAVAEYIACIFHATRSVEVGLHAVHACLAIAVPTGGNDRNNWGSILKRIKDAIDQRGKAWGEKELFEELYAMMAAIGHAWRNPTMHVAKSYTEADAERIFRVVADFIEKLSLRMDENGLPLA
ncbi:MAG TPA: hypothetical protein VGV14_11555 [Rhodanobacter sp.]|nr:hypothetical protein [Rhodanobacter sp.]